MIALPLRVHTFASGEHAIAAGLDDATLAARTREIERIFAPAGIHWVIDPVVVERPADDGPFREKLLGNSAPGALKELIQRATRRSPQGFDLYVVRELRAFGFGGVYVCNTDGEAGHGVSFIASEDGRGHPQPVRKWAHELGHALGLPHTPCDAEHADSLMMSGKCEFARAKRVSLSDEEITRIRKQALVGGPVACGERKLEEDD